MHITYNQLPSTVLPANLYPDVVKKGKAAPFAGESFHSTLTQTVGDGLFGSFQMTPPLNGICSTSWSNGEVRVAAKLAYGRGCGYLN